ncbi:alpha/beta hydrolase-fold protein [Flavihumibacter fluvii]|uniref:alpha/beta hydrolase-fold protein n=1 Tax=Flavihumibacter fluvii TaxID=2838157 RepID=UPI001BDF0408|nr:alpha/beta hydrolase-fold protein [Flavihumibacter fluvii]ULQ53958.1 esterase family protein [Flavihumibacter fluvii]
MKNMFSLSKSLFLLLLLVIQSGLKAGAQITVLDSRHYSNVFGEMRNFRIFLPTGYQNSPDKRYPVIYFLHGWSQRYFGSGEDIYAAYDTGHDNNGDNIEQFVLKHEVIVVKSDGYNSDANDPYYKRPYNVGPVETYRQFPIYFEELVHFIDGTYNTRNNRTQRAITGLSMGGFMAYFIGGKYPQLFSAIGSFCPSAEFLIGPKDFPVEYSHLYMYKNYGGTRVFLNYGDKDFIRSYHEDRNRIWTQVLDNYSYKVYPGEHSTAGLGEMFKNLFKTFGAPPQKPLKWAHIDIYPDFSVWDYTVNSDRNIPGFTTLENVDAQGFKSVVREFLPDGGVLPFVNLSVLTPAIYEKNTSYTINDYDAINHITFQKVIISDNSGRLKITLNGSLHHIGINKVKDNPNISMVSYKAENMNSAIHKKDVAISMVFLNNGQMEARHVKAKLSASNSNTIIDKSESVIGDIGINETKYGNTPFVFHVKGDSIEIVRFKLTMQDDSKREWTEFFEIEIKADMPEILDVTIADGRILPVARSGTEIETIRLGIGNGDGLANPGESIVLLVKDQGKYWRTSLFSTDININPFGVNVRKSDSWENFDFVGGSAKYSVPLLSSDCPEGRRIDFLATYWIPGIEKTHITKKGKISIEVKGKDSSPPSLQTVQIPGDNILQARLSDGSKITYVKATVILVNNPEKKFEIELKDTGIHGDRVAGDLLFCNIIPSKNFGLYKVMIEAKDYYGNKLTAEVPGTFILH